MASAYTRGMHCKGGHEAHKAQLHMTFHGKTVRLS